MSMGERIRRRRQELGLTVEEVSRALGKNRATVYRYERGDIEDLPTTALEPLSRVLQTTPSYLAGWTEDVDGIEGLLAVRSRRVPLVGAIACGEPICAGGRGAGGRGGPSMRLRDGLPRRQHDGRAHL